ncbi:hypothetical protein Afil01_02020 [Actinorhabdospora filicis]|uniref:Uncharacterized protein n=1 Tax=Actinorhabdospora filicis TaxID=1785913 RepID=A0A9W6W883_9ACTN|nr:hypothetical protein Afil01_02020 [Actinorhabdospora filicis]
MRSASKVSATIVPSRGPWFTTGGVVPFATAPGTFTGAGEGETAGRDDPPPASPFGPASGAAGSHPVSAASGSAASNARVCRRRMGSFPRE